METGAHDVAARVKPLHATADLRPDSRGSGNPPVAVPDDRGSQDPPVRPRDGRGPEKASPRPVRRAVAGSRRHVAAFGFIAALGLLTLVAMGTLPWTLDWYDVQQFTAARAAPSLWPRGDLDAFANRAARDADALADSQVPAVARAASWLGHDDLGRSLLFRLLPGFLISLGIGLCAGLIATVFGVLWGCVAATAGGGVDRVMMRIVDVLYGLPYVLTVILLKIALTRPLSAILGGSKAAGVIILLLAIGGVSWLTMARVVRGQVLSLRSRGFVEVARACGAGSVHLILRHYVPNIAGPVLVYAALVIPQAMMQEAFLSFLGIGVPAPLPSLGRLAAEGVEAVNTFVAYWWLIVFPCGILFFTLLALNAAADGLRDRLDPKAGLRFA